MNFTLCEQPVMTDQAATANPGRKTDQKKSRWPKKTLIVIAIIAAILAALPYGIAYTIKRALLNAGAESAHVEDIDFNLFKGDLKVKRLHVKVPELPEVVLDTAYVDLDWSALLKKHIVIDHLKVHDTDIRIEKNADGSINVIGLEVLPAGDPDAAPVEEQGGAIPFVDGAGVALFEIDDINLTYIDPSINVTLVIDNLKIEKVYSWDADSAADLAFDGSLNGAPITIRAQVKAFGETQSADIKIKADALDLQTFEKIAGEAIPELAGKLGIDTQFTVSLQENLVSIHNDGDINISGLAVAFDGGRIQNDNIDWDGMLDLSLPIPAHGAEAIPPTANNVARLSSSGLKLTLSEPSLTINSDQLRWDGSISQDETGISSLTVQGAVMLSNTAVEMAAEQPLSAALADLQIADLAVTGTDKVKLGTLTVSKAQVELSGDSALKAGIDSLQAKQFQMTEPEQIAIGSLAVSGIDTTIPGDKPINATVASLSSSNLKVTHNEQVSAAGLDIKDIRVTDHTAQLDLAVIAAVAISQININSTDAIKLGSIKASSIKGLAGSGDKAAQMFLAKRLDVTALAFNNGNELDIQRVELQDSTTTLKRLKNGKWYLLDDIISTDKSTTAAASETPPADDSAIKFRIGEIKTSGENSLHYADATVNPAADINIIIDTFSITDIDSKAPSATPNKFKLAARIGKYGKLDSDGSLRPMSTPPVADLKLKLDDLDLKVASPLLVGAVGYIIESGSIDLDTTFKIDPKGDMSGENTIKLTQLVLKQGDPEVMAKVNSSSPMPLDAALDLLRDKHNVIEMDIPISGNINDPNVDFSDAIGQAIGSIAGTAAMTALTTVGPAAALGPIGLVAILGKMGADQLTKVRLASIEYAPGSAERPADSDKDLKNAAEILAKDEKFNLRLCPFYTLEDARAVAGSEANKQRSPLTTHKEEITQLAKQRAESLKDLLVSQYKLDPGRIQTCTPELDDSASAMPHVEFGL